MIDHPLKWLVAELATILAPDELAELTRRLNAHKAAYYREAKIRTVERMIDAIQRRYTPEKATQLARWQSKLRRLKAQRV